MSPALHRIAVQPWMRDRATQNVLAALRASGGAVRFVGGCVRNSILGTPVGDIDLATTLHPQDVVRALEAAGLKAVPTGLTHGTVTAVADGRPFEITTLRRDVETDGRHAVVAFTDDWALDAQRRDFTLNALFAEDDGLVLDHVGGFEDLAQRRVRFVGDAGQRIREDYLRVLRFFRFSAWYAALPYDREGLTACAAAAAGLQRLSGERVRKELMALLAAAEPTPAVREMIDAGVLAHWLVETQDSATLATLVTIERDLGAGDALRRLAALLPDGADVTVVAERLRLSADERERLAAMLAQVADAELQAPPAAWRRAIYRQGAQGFIDHVLLHAARERTAAASNASSLQAAADLAARWTPPDFPLRGADVLALGLSPGAMVGSLLHEIEAWWIGGDFAAGRAECLAALERAVEARGPAC